MNPIVLASGSVHRRRLLADAGVDFAVERPRFDERAAEAPLQAAGASPAAVALALAEGKAAEVSARLGQALAIGCDQTLSLGSEVFHKPADIAEARLTLSRLSGRTHHLNSAVVLAVAGAIVWRHVSTAALAMRALSAAAIERYLAEAGPAILSSVGCYQIEGPGLRLMETIEGDYWTIVGLPLLPLLAELRRRGAIEA